MQVKEICNQVKERLTDLKTNYRKNGVLMNHLRYTHSPSQNKQVKMLNLLSLQLIYTFCQGRMKEGRIPLAEATVYLATSPKSNSAYEIIPSDWSSDVCSSDLKYR